MDKHNNISEKTILNKVGSSLEEKTYMEMMPEEIEYKMKEAVFSSDKEDLSGFVTIFDESGGVNRKYDDEFGTSIK